MAPLELSFERAIAASPSKLFSAWLNPKVAGTCWNSADKLTLKPKVGSFFYILHDVYPHYGRFLKLDRPSRIQLTWMSPNTRGLESMVTVTFKKKGAGTLMKLVHSGLPNDAGGRAHDGGWKYYLDIFTSEFGELK